MKKKVYPYLFLAPSLIGTAIFSFLPLLDVFRRSFAEPMGNTFSGVTNFISVWNNDAFRLALGNTLKFLGTSVPLLLLISLISALLIYYLKGNKGVFRTTLLLPLGIPVASSTLFFKMFFQNGGWLNQLVPGLLPDKNWLKGNTAFGVLVFCYIWKNTGYDMILWCAGLQGIDSSLYEAAKVDGAGGIRMFYYITLPLLKGTAGTILILSALNTFKIFREAYLLAGDYPDRSIYMLQHLFNNWFVSLDVQKMTAAAVMTAGGMLFCLVLLLLVLRKGKGHGKVEKT